MDFSNEVPDFKAACCLCQAILSFAARTFLLLLGVEGIFGTVREALPLSVINHF